MLPSSQNQIQVCREIKSLLDDIAWLRYGVIYNVEILPSSDKICRVLVSEQKRRLIDEIENGNYNLALVNVHRGEPTYAEVPGTTPSGLKCLRKVKFD
jgi:hypothetical protein